MFINWQLREMNLKIVYYGPALSGKTTNLEQIYAKMDPRRRGELISLNTHEDRTIFFDFVQLELNKIGGLTPKIHLYTVPGQVFYQNTRKVVLSEADGVVFVADAGKGRLKDNLISWRSMQQHLYELKITMATLPIVLQCNKQDLPQTISTPIIQRVLGASALPTVESIAIEGQGVIETLKLAINGVIKQVRQKVAADRS